MIGMSFLGLQAPRHFVDRASWFTHCLVQHLNMRAEVRAGLLLLVVAGLGVSFVWAFWEIEQYREHRLRTRRTQKWRQTD